MDVATSRSLVRANMTWYGEFPRAAPPREPGLHLSTSRALVLREAARGKGELSKISRKISGQEKLYLLADEMVNSAVRAPLRMKELLKMVESQLGVHLDEISNLKDPAFFCDDILVTINSRIESLPDSNGKRNIPLHDVTWIASVVGTRIHNAYTLAGSWRIVRNILRDLELMGFDDTNATAQLRENQTMRAQYILVYEMVTFLACLGQQRLASCAAAAPHYSGYFVRKDNGNPKDPEMEFDQRGSNRRKIREAHKSYIDTIVLELVLPDSQYPPYVLISCLSNAVEECRKEGKRFTQAFWDAMGDFSVTIQMLHLLESPLLGIKDAWIGDAVRLNKQLTRFFAAHKISTQACTMVESWKTYLRPPLTSTKKPDVLAQLWEGIDRAYRKVSGVGIDTLWSLQEDLERAPQWTDLFSSDLAVNEEIDTENRSLTFREPAIIQYEEIIGRLERQVEEEDDDDYSSMPDLVEISDSTDGDDSSFTSEGDSESDYDTEEDEWLQDTLQDALDAVDVEDLPNVTNVDSDGHDAKGSENPFKTMFSRLKNRVFPADPTLKVNDQSRRPFKWRHGPGAENVASTSYGAGDVGSPLVAPGNLVQTMNSDTIEELEGEGLDVDKLSRKKKKKKKKKNQKVQGTASKPLEDHLPALGQSRPLNGSSVEESSVKSATRSSLDIYEANFSRLSFPSKSETAQSARSYLQSEHAATEKTKVKSRPAFGRSFLGTEKREKLSSDSERDGIGLIGKIQSLYLPRRARELLSRLLGPADGKTHAKRPMKWEEFLKLMQSMGFSCDPSTAGSSVRFDPPNPKDPSITFHKPHPDSTLQRGHLRDFGKRLKKAYGWSPELFKLPVGKDE